MAAETAWVSVWSNPGNHRRIYHTDERCFQQRRPRVPTLVQYAVRAGLLPCKACAGREDDDE